SAGVGRIRSAGSIGDTIETSFFLMGDHSDPGRAGASLSVEALGDARIQNVSNPTLLSSQGATNNNLPGFRSARAYFRTYSQADRFELVSVGGDIFYDGTPRPARSQNRTFTDDWWLTPPQSVLTALSGDVSGGGFAAPLRAFPSTLQQLRVLAGGDVHGLRIEAADADPATLPAWNSAIYRFTDVPLLAFSRTGATPRLTAYGEQATWQVGALGSVYDSQIYFPGAAKIRAGLDIDTVQMDLQNLAASDLTEVRAGRDIRYHSQFRNGLGADSGGGYIFIGGSGALLVQAGRGIDLGRSDGIRAVGLARNPTLAAQGISPTSATVNMVTGYSGDLSTADIDKLLTLLKEIGTAQNAREA